VRRCRGEGRSRAGSQEATLPDLRVRRMRGCAGATRHERARGSLGLHWRQRDQSRDGGRSRHGLYPFVRPIAVEREMVVVGPGGFLSIC
jgi:hypothetical protein